MGQYRLWLQYREIDQLLHTQLKTLVKELTQVDEQINLLASNTLQVDNVIIQALLKELQVSLVPVPDMPVQATSSPIRSSLTDELPLVDAVDKQDQQLPDSVSSALFMWGNSSKFVSQEMQDLAKQTDLLESVPPIPLSTENLLPADRQTFVETCGPTAPQAKCFWRLPDLLRSSHSTPGGDSLASPVDQQSIRVNQVVKRWFERRTHFAHGDRNLEEQKESMV